MTTWTNQPPTSESWTESNPNSALWASSSPTINSKLLQEDGYYLLQEDEYYILLDGYEWDSSSQSSGGFVEDPPTNASWSISTPN